MRLQIIKDGEGKNTGVFVPISDWNIITQKHKDLEQLVSIEPMPKQKLSDLAGSLSHETAQEMQKYIEESRSGWDERIRKQF